MPDQAGFDAWAAGYDAAVSASAQAGAYPFAGCDAVPELVFCSVMAGGCRSVPDPGSGTGALTARFVPVSYCAAVLMLASAKNWRKSAAQQGSLRGAVFFNFSEKSACIFPPHLVECLLPMGV